VFGPYEMIDMKNQIMQAAARCGRMHTDQGYQRKRVL